MKPYKTSWLLLYVTLFSLFYSCDKIEDTLLSDAEILMKEMNGTWKLKSVHEEELFSSTGGSIEAYGHTFDSTYAASGDLVINVASDNKSYTGSMKITYKDIDETNSINGNCVKTSSSDAEEYIYVISPSDDAIQALFMYSVGSTYIKAKILNRSKDGFILVFSEYSYDYSYLKKRTYEYTK